MKSRFSKCPVLLMIIPVLLLVVSMGACKKDSSPSTNSSNNDTTAANLEASTTAGDNAFDDIFQTSVQAGYDNNIAYISSQPAIGLVQINKNRSGTQTMGILGCAIYTVTPNDLTTFPKTILVDFGTGCTSATGVTRKGQISYIYSGKLVTPGTTVMATFSNYSVNGYGLQGAYSITNNSSLANGIAFTTKVTNGSITFPDATSYTYSGTKTVTQTAGMSTPTVLTDDIFSIIGNNSFAGNGNSITNTITTPLSKAYTCKFVQSGIISFVYDTNTKGTLDFGNGICDSLVTIKVGNYSKDVTLQ